MPKVSRNTRKQWVKTDLHKQLEQDGKVQKYWYDLVDDYLALWEIKEKLKTDIERNGVMVLVTNGQQQFRKRNDAVVELPKISKRMTDILEVLDIKATSSTSDNDGGDDDDF